MTQATKTQSTADSSSVAPAADNAPAEVEINSKDFSGTAWFYELSSNIFSAGQIAASKSAQIQWMQPGDRVLYLGVGAGEDAILAARKGVELTCIDLSSSMIKRLQRKLDKENLQATLICGDAFEHKLTGHYDVVATNFFLNCFVEEQMLEMMRHAVSLIRPLGKYMIADVATPQGNLVARAFNHLYLRSAMASFWIMGLVPWHPNYDYSEYFPQFQLQLESTEGFRFFKFGPIVFQNTVATKQT
jgi:demethylmenaquinone methyltransferase/2-methoxy-6-polyprenyl-1,4-benzoquinol methylase